MTSRIQNQQPFARQTVLLLFGVGVSAFIGAMIVMAFSDFFDPSGGSRNNTFSSSALGHLLAAEFLEELGFEVSINRRDFSQVEFTTETLILAEPSIANFNEDEQQFLSNFSNVILVLPKRSGVQHPIRPNWILDAPLLPTNLVAGQASQLIDNLEIVRTPEPDAWSSSHFRGLRPSLPDLQLAHSPQLTPLLATDAGSLIGAVRLPDYQLIVISDPDLIANHGLAEGDNAAIFAQLVDMIAGRHILWDETNHGFKISDSIWRATFEPPLIAITISAALTLTILLLATTYRFGSSIPTPAAFDPGKQTLVLTAAKLFADDRHHDGLMQRYLIAGLRRTAHRLNAPSGPITLETLEWLERIGTAKGLNARKASTPLEIYHALAQNHIDHETLITLVKDYFDWRTEILDGFE